MKKPKINRRNRRLLSNLTKQDQIIEIGPLHAPIAPKREGWNVTIVDHDNQSGLKRKYKNDPSVNTAVIEEVDVIWGHGSLSEAFATDRHGSFRALISSHSIEHIPDMIGFLNAAQTLLHPTDGILVLAVPDKRLCFDFFRPPSTTGQVLEAHRKGGRVHAANLLFDHVAYHVNVAGRISWSHDALRDICFSHTLQEAKEVHDAYRDEPDSPYIDIHAWVFTPASFELVILELAALGIIDFRIDWIEPKSTLEFLCHLRPGRDQFSTLDSLNSRRLKLLRQQVRELSEQAHMLAASKQPIFSLLLLIRRLVAKLRERI